MGRLSGRPDPITWACLSGSRGQIGRSERLEAWEGFEVGEILCCRLWRWRRGSMARTMGGWDGPPDDSPLELGTSALQPQRRDFNYNPVSLDEVPGLQRIIRPGWCLDFGLVRTWAEKPAAPCLDFWPTEQPDHKWMFKAAKRVVICYTIENSSQHCLSYRNNRGKEERGICLWGGGRKEGKLRDCCFITNLAPLRYLHI